MGIVDRLILIGVPVALVLLSLILPRNKVFKKVIQTVLVLATAGVAVIPLIAPLADLVGVTAATRLTGFEQVILLAEAAILLWGLFFGDAYLTQGLYGMVSFISLVVGCYRFIIPTWTKATSLAEAFASTDTILKMAGYAVLVLVPAWLICSGSFRVKLASAWNTLIGLSFFGSILLFLTKAELINAAIGNKLMTVLGDLKALNAEDIKTFGIAAGILVATTLVLCVLVSLIQSKTLKKGEKMIASETKGALVIRLVGRFIAGVGSLALLAFLPGMLVGSTGIGAAAVLLAPIGLVLVVSILTEFFSEDVEIKRAQAAAQAA
ncbi:MAG: hypothetical protein ACI3XE_00305 [Eubacteriales bacterium]